MIYTFYSYKGGVGRSMALANVAECLYRRGARVLTIDWDLEAPGLEHFFLSSPAKRDELRAQLGLIDMLLEYRRQYSAARLAVAPEVTKPFAEEPAKAPGPSATFEAVKAQLLPLKTYLYPIHAPESDRSRGLWLLPAGWRAMPSAGGGERSPSDDRFSKYAQAVQSFDWADLYDNFEAEAYFNWLKTELVKSAADTATGAADTSLNFDTVLIDSRTGVTEMGGVCTRQLADVVVSFCAPNYQNLDGVVKMSRSVARDDVKRFRDGVVPQVLVVPSRVDQQGETTEQNRFHARFDEALQAPPALTHVGLKMWELLIPYIVKYAYQETLTIGTDDSNEVLSRAYWNLSAALTAFSPPDSRLRALLGPDLAKLTFGSGTASKDDALVLHVSATLQQFSAEEREHARRVLLRLVTVTAESGALSRSRFPAGELDPEAQKIAQRLLDAGVLVRLKEEGDVDLLELESETLIQRWTTLRDWVQEDREFLARRAQLRAYMTEWKRSGGDAVEILPRGLATEALDWRQNRPHDLSAAELDFIAATGRTQFDVLVSASRQDQAVMERLTQSLEQRGIRARIPDVDFAHGASWLKNLEEVLSSVRGLVVLVGSRGLTETQKRLIYLALDRQPSGQKSVRPFPVIPISLPHADAVVSGSLALNWITLRDVDDIEPAAAAVVQALRETTVDADLHAPRTVYPEVNPYRGLEAFKEEHSSLFLGRAALVNDVVSALSASPLAALVGASGSGKSSLVHAGVIPLLRRHLPPQPTWTILSIRLFDDVFRSIAEAAAPLLSPSDSAVDEPAEAGKLAVRLETGDLLLEDLVGQILRTRATDRLLVAVDQFEAIFDAPLARQQLFVHGLLGVCHLEHVAVLIVIRADYYGRALDLSRELAERLAERTIQVAPMSLADLEQAVVLPAQLGGVRFESGLVQRILSDASTQPGSLPLLQFTLAALWETRDRRMITHEAYARLGGLNEALARLAENVYEKLPAEQRPILRRILRSLIQLSPDGHVFTKVVPRKHLDARPRAADVIDTLVSARLLAASRNTIAGSDTIEIGHEALVRSWPRLSQWINEDRDTLRRLDRLRDAAVSWEESKLHPRFLLRGPLLAEAVRLRDDPDITLSLEDRRFVEQSLYADRARRKRRFAVVAAIMFVSLFMSAMFSFYVSRANAARRLETARADGLAQELAAFTADQPQITDADKVDRAAILASVDGRRRRALEVAFALKDENIPFRWGGKKPAEGLDTSGFIAYILNQVGVIDAPGTYWSGKLRTAFPATGSGPARPGDLLFEVNRACWFRLADDLAIGMVPQGIVIGRPSTFSSPVVAEGRVPYEQTTSPR